MRMPRMFGHLDAYMEIKTLHKINDYQWEIPKIGKMLVPGIIFGDQKLVEEMDEKVKEQVQNVACLPGILKASLAMPDAHLGYGFTVGGVAAMDENEGVISVGGIGFDSGCLSGDTKVLTELGYTKKFEEFETNWKKEEIKCANPSHKILNTPITRFLKYKPWQEVFKVITESGKEIVATEDHPFYTPKGMADLKKLSSEDKIAVYPFEGVEYDDPPDKVLIDEDKIKQIAFSFEKDSRGNGIEQILTNLNKRKLLPLKPTSPQFPYLLKVMGYVFGDGNIYFVNAREKGITWFWGDPEDLEEVREDIKKIGYTPSKIYFRKRHHKIKTFYGISEFDRVEWSFKVCSSSFALLLAALGAPVGEKANQNYLLPSFLFDLPLWQKRLFLASFFGAELSSPKLASDNQYNFSGPVLSLDKHQKFVKSGRQFLKQIKKLLEEFSVRSTLMKEREEYVTKKKEVSMRLRLFIYSDIVNLVNFWSKINHEYNQKKRYLANGALQYFKLKQKVLKERNTLEKEAKKLRKKGLNVSQIYQKLQSPWINKKFIERSVYEERKENPRIAYKFIKFPQFLEEATEGLGKTGVFWDKIISKEKINFNDFVYDFTVLNENHNFIANNLVVSNCGVRTLKTNLTLNEVQSKIEKLVNSLFETVPCGLGSRGKIVLSEKEADELFREGARWVVKRGYGAENDLLHIEDKGSLEGANPDYVSERAKKRERGQVGTLGSGNHYEEIQYVDEIYDKDAAQKFGLFKNQILISIHCGSRALGHQIGTDYLKILAEASRKYQIPIRDRELVCAPIKSEEGKRYAAANLCALNYSYANRQVIAHLTRECFGEFFPGAKIETLWDLTHNSARWEHHEIDGELKKVLVHRKGATRAFGPQRKELPEDYREVGQPVIIGGTMGTCSFILRGTENGMKLAFGSASHGAGRAMSRTKAKKFWRGQTLIEDLKRKGIYAKTASFAGFAEEAPGAYKDVVQVIEAVDKAGLAKKVVRMKPLGVIKG